MRMKQAVKINAEIHIDSDEAEVINHLCSYDLAEFFSSKCSHKYSAGFIKTTLNRLRDLSAIIMDARDKAIKAIEEYPTS